MEIIYKNNCPNALHKRVAENLKCKTFRRVTEEGYLSQTLFELVLFYVFNLFVTIRTDAIVTIGGWCVRL